jgi:hypothetical protein
MGENSVMANRTIQKPYWATPEKDRVICELHYDDGRILTATISDTAEGNPDWHELMNTIGTSVIDENTANMQAQLNERKEQEQLRKKENEDKMKGDVIFGAKLEAFEIPEIKASKDRVLKSKIRKATTLAQVQAYSSVLVMKELEKGDATE